MVVLKKIKASTLMETLVATVLIIVVFMVASMILNNLFYNSLKNNTTDVDAYLNELQYLYANDKLTLPFVEDYEDWSISVTSYKADQTTIVEFEAININTNTTLLKQVNEINQ
jgi:predicted PurR-regulated permease PerM